MFNRLTNVFVEQSPAVSDNRWRTDARPALRLCWLALLMLLPMVVIAARVSYLQTSTAERFAKPFEQTYVTFESVPSRDGRLLSADGRVLATDRLQFTVQVHYRWLEEPADPVWLKSQALAQLTRSQRRNAELLAKTKEQILAERDAMWKRLAKLSGRSPEELSEKRAKIQRHVEGIVTLVEQRQAQREKPRQTPTDGTDTPAWKLVWERFSRSVTSPPSRGNRDPIIIREELDYHPLLEGIPLTAVAEIESQPKRYLGLKIDTMSWRDYPQDRLAAHLVGVRKPLTAEEADDRQQHLTNKDPLGYEVGDRIGRMGLEQVYDHHLHGLKGQRRVVRNRRGEITERELIREPRGGNDLVLTLNASLQERLERMVDQNVEQPTEEPRPASAGASLVVLDVRTGAVVAAVSAPRFSLQELLHPTPEEWQKINADPRQPFFHRATHMTVAPGSIFKAVTAVAFLESGQIDPDAARFCQGFLDRSDRHRCYTYRHFGVGHGDLNLAHAICRSCNVYFFQGARKIGPDPLVDWAERFGIGQKTGIDLPGEKAGNLPKPPRQQPPVATSNIVQASFSPVESSNEVWYPGDTLGLAIGQSRLTVTPLQMARVMAAIANDGFLVTPHVVQGFGPSSLSEGETTRRMATPEPRPIPGLTEGTLARVREGLEMVVSHPKGTGYKSVRMPEVEIAGKTGTAEVGGGLSDHAWFAGYAPADRPKYAFAIILEHAGSGGKNAGPVARQTVEILLELGLIQGK